MAFCNGSGVVAVRDFRVFPDGCAGYLLEEVGTPATGEHLREDIGTVLTGLWTFMCGYQPDRSCYDFNIWNRT